MKAMLQKVVDIVKEASALMVTDHFAVMQKDGYTNLVTSSDLAVQHFLTEKLAALELCLLASGVIELFFEMRLQPWDHAAGNLILQEAGGCIATWDGSAPSITRPTLVVAANRTDSLEELLATVRRHLPDGIPY